MLDSSAELSEMSRPGYLQRVGKV